jgi:Fe-S cluster biogenesis protein NfuA
MSSQPPSPPAVIGDVAATFRKVAKVINAVRPSIQADGGDVELIDVTTTGVVKIRLHGACVGCPSSAITLTEGIERNIKANVPEVTEIESVD